MDTDELLNKLAQIEEQANYTLAEFPKTLTRERLRMIIALARYMRAELSTNRDHGATAGKALSASTPDRLRGG